MPKAILLDWDDTLAHTRNSVVEAIEYVLEKYHKEPWDITKNKYRDTKKSLKENFPNFFGDNYIDAYNDYLEHYIKYTYNKIHPTEYSHNFLKFCNQNNIDLYIISNKEKSLLLKEAEFCFPDILFKKILGNGDASQNKPDPAPVFEALKDSKYEINKENIWLIGDSKQDTECAYRAKIQPVLIGTGKFMDNVYITNKTKSDIPLLTFNNFNEVIDYLKNKKIT